MIRRAFYGPPDWIVERYPSHVRRAIGFWSLIGAASFTPIFGSKVMYVTILSVLALVPNFAAETPVETEE